MYGVMPEFNKENLRPMELPVLLKIFDNGVTHAVVYVLLIYAIVALWRRNISIEDKRDRDSIDREKTMTVAMETVTEGLQNLGDVIRISIKGKSK